MPSYIYPALILYIDIAATILPSGFYILAPNFVLNLLMYASHFIGIRADSIEFDSVFVSSTADDVPCAIAITKVSDLR